MPQLFSNAAKSLLQSSLLAADTSLTLADNGAAFPVANRGTGTTGDWFKIVLDDSTNLEVVYVRTHTSGSVTFSNLLRGQEGTTARAWNAGAVVGLRLTAQDFSQVVVTQKYMGLATPSTTPVAVEGYYYLTTTPGTYTNFSGLVVGTEQAYLRYNGTAWVEDVALNLNHGGICQVVSGSIVVSSVYASTSGNNRLFTVTVTVSSGTKVMGKLGIRNVTAGTFTFPNVVGWVSTAANPTILSVSSAGALTVGTDTPWLNMGIGALNHTGTSTYGGFYPFLPMPGEAQYSYQRYKQVWDVREFGVFGDGLADYTAKLAAGISYLRNTFGTATTDFYGNPVHKNIDLFFPNGTYYLTGDVFNYHGFGWIGQSQGGTIIKGVNNFTDKTPQLRSWIPFNATPNRVPFRLVEKITFDDVLPVMSYLGASNVDAEGYEGVSRFEECTFTGTINASGSYALKCYGTKVDYVFRSCTFDYPRTFTHITATDVRSIEIEFCKFRGGSSHALNMERIRSARIANNSIIATSSAYGWTNAIYFPASRRVPTENVVVDGNVIEGAHEEAIGFDALGDNVAGIPNICNGPITLIEKIPDATTKLFHDYGPVKIKFDMLFYVIEGDTPALAVLGQDSTVTNTETDWITLPAGTAALKPGMTVSIKSGTAGASVIDGSATGTATILEATLTGPGIWDDGNLTTTQVRIDKTASVKIGTTLQFYGWGAYHVEDRTDWTNFHLSFDEGTGVDGLISRVVDFDPVEDTLTIDTKLPMESFTGTGRVGLHSGFYNCVISNNVIRNCRTVKNPGAAIGISLFGSAFGCKIIGNHISDCDRGISVAGAVVKANFPNYYRLVCYNNVIANNIILSSREQWNFAIGALYVASGAASRPNYKLYQRGNVITGNIMTGEGGMVINWQDGVVISNNIVSGGGDILLSDCLEREVVGNTLYDGSELRFYNCANTLPTPSATWLGRVFMLMDESATGFMSPQKIGTFSASRDYEIVTMGTSTVAQWQTQGNFYGVTPAVGVIFRSVGGYSYANLGNGTARVRVTGFPSSITYHVCKLVNGVYSWVEL